MKITKAGVLLIFALSIALLGIAVQSFNMLAGRHREQVQQELHRVLGTDVTYDRLTVSLWNGIGFSAHGFRIADDSRFAATPLVYANELLLGVSWWELLLGRIVIDSMTFKDPEFQIITNEQGSLNVAALDSRKKQIGEFPNLPAQTAERQRAPVRFTIDSMHVKNGRIDYVDRSVKEPAELQIKNVWLSFKGLDPERPSRFMLTAALTEALDRDVRIEGQLGPMVSGRAWAHQPIDLRLQVDSLHVPLLGRAIAFLRNKIPRELDVTGPMSLQARLSGTLAKPRISDLVLNVPLFGSSDYNAVLTGAMDLSHSGSWEEAQLNGTLRLDGIDFRQLRRLDFLKHNLPAGLAGHGLINVNSRFEGSWDKLRVGAVIQADDTELQFADWLRKPAGTKVRLETKLSRHGNALRLHESRLVLGDSHTSLFGRIDDLRQPSAVVRFYSGQSSVAAWGKYFSPLEFHGIRGTSSWDIAASKNLAAPQEPWRLEGRLSMAGARFRHQKSGRTLEDLSADIVFLGQQVRVDRALFRLGSSQVALAGSAPELGTLPLHYRIHSAELNLADLSQNLPLPPARLREVIIEGAVRLQNGATVMSGSVASRDGTVRNLPYRSLRADVSWSDGGLTFENLALQTLNGTLYSNGSLAQAEHAFDIAPRLQSVDVQALLAELWPQLKDRIEGKLDFQGRFSAVGNGNGTKRLRGFGDALVTRGTVKNFNLLTHVFSRSSGSDQRVSASLPSALADLAKRPDTRFDSFKARLTVSQERLHTDQVMLSTPDYTVTGSGSIGFDRTAKWSGSLTLSPRLTQELQREYGTLRYLVDRRGRLSFTFRVDGKIPNLKLKHENRALAQILRLVAAQRPTAGGAGDGKKETQPPTP